MYPHAKKSGPSPLAILFGLLLIAGASIGGYYAYLGWKTEAAVNRIKATIQTQRSRNESDPKVKAEIDKLEKENAVLEKKLWSHMDKFTDRDKQR